jgi:hypothetical protein
MAAGTFAERHSYGAREKPYDAGADVKKKYG